MWTSLSVENDSEFRQILEQLTPKVAAPKIEQSWLGENVKLRESEMLHLLKMMGKSKWHLKSFPTSEILSHNQLAALLFLFGIQCSWRWTNYWKPRSKCLRFYACGTQQGCTNELKAVINPSMESSRTYSASLYFLKWLVLPTFVNCIQDSSFLKVIQLDDKLRTKIIAAWNACVNECKFGFSAHLYNSGEIGGLEADTAFSRKVS